KKRHEPKAEASDTPTHRAGAHGSESADACRQGGGRETQGHRGAGVWPEQSSAGVAPLLAAWLEAHPWCMASGRLNASSAQDLALRSGAEPGLSCVETHRWA